MSAVGSGELAEVLLRSSTPGVSQLVSATFMLFIYSVPQPQMRKVVFS